MRDIVGIVHSKENGRVLCIEESFTYVNEYKDKIIDNIGIVYVSISDYHNLLRKNIHVQEWNVNDMPKERFLDIGNS